MIGIFDSGSGGKFAYGILEKLLPREKLTLLIDSENAPYGIKSEDEIIALAEKNIEKLVDLGCDTVLIACCTASTVYGRLSPSKRSVALPIIRPTAYAAARATKRGKIAVIATEATVRSGEFTKEIKRISPMVEVTEMPTQELVRMVDESGGTLDGAPREYFAEIIDRVVALGADALVLGCTHFHAAKSIFENIIEYNNLKITVVSSAEVGAHLAAERIKEGALALGKEISKWENTEEAELTMP